MACLSRLAVASVNTHRTRWPTPTPTQTRGVTYIYVLKCITHTAPLRTGLPLSFRLLQPSPVSPATRLHGHRTSSLLSRRPGTFLPAESEFCKSASCDNIQAEARNSIAHACSLVHAINFSDPSRQTRERKSGQRWISSMTLFMARTMLALFHPSIDYVTLYGFSSTAILSKLAARSSGSSRDDP